MNLKIASCLVLTACSEGVFEGTSIGNPTEMVVLIAPSDEIELTEGSVGFSSIDTVFLDGESTTIETSTELNLVEGEAIETPEEAWIALNLNFTTPVEMYGTLSSGQPAKVILNLSSMWLLAEDQPVSLKDRSVILELASPNWLNANIEDLEENDEGYLEIEYEAYEILMNSGLYPDDDRDRRISDSEREEREPVFTRASG